MHSVAVTAHSVVSPLGSTTAELWSAVRAGHSAVRAIRGSIVTQDFPIPFGGVVAVPELAITLEDNYQLRSPSEYARWSTFLMPQLAIDAFDGIPIDGIILGTNEGTTFNTACAAQGAECMTALLPELRTNNATGAIKKYLTDCGYPPLLDGNVITIHNACASGAAAIGMGFQRIRSGQWRRAIVGALEPRMNPSALMALHALGALSVADVPPAQASCPFSLRRQGFVKAQGGALLLLECEELAKQRKAPILSFIRGFGTSSDAWRFTEPREDGVGARDAMQRALRDARLEPTQIDYINAHGTSTKVNDRVETIAIKQVFETHAYDLAVSSLKSQMGHATVAAGAIEGVACGLMLLNQRLAPTINLHERDPECDLDYVPHESRSHTFRYALSNSFGFGGLNACLVFERGDTTHE
jgi:3-oxoacyl-[acyl-carrier-protein] synthase II